MINFHQLFSTVILVIATFFAILPSVHAQAPTMTRTVGNDNTCRPTVAISIHDAGDTQVLIIQENLPAGLEAFNISDGGVYVEIDQTVKWTFPYVNNDGVTVTVLPSLVTYQASGPSATYTVSGDGDFDASHLAVAITGTSDINIDCATVSLDVDGNGRADALTDGLLIVRQLLGKTGSELIAGAVASDCDGRCDAAAIIDFLTTTDAATMLNVDGSGGAEASTDGVIILRFLFGFRDQTLIAGACDQCSITAVNNHLLLYLP